MQLGHEESDDEESDQVNAPVPDEDGRPARTGPVSEFETSEVAADRNAKVIPARLPRCQDTKPTGAR